MREWWFLGAVLGAHVKQQKGGFRQKDARFMLELMASWRWSAEERRAFPPLHNTQISRRLTELTHLGWLKPLTRSSQPRYRLSRAGLVGVLEKLRAGALNGTFEDYAFLSHLLQSYRELLLQMIEADEPALALPLPQRLEVERILDGRGLTRERAQRLRGLIYYWRRRIEENQAIVALAKERLKGGAGLQEVIAEVERRYPYELNYAKPLTMLYAELPEELKAWELTEGQSRRAERVWAVTVRSLQAELNMLEER
jgi:hypothetical protein